MPRYRKRPVEIDGFRLGYDPMPDWFMDRVSSNQVILHGAYGLHIEGCSIKTLEGIMTGNYGDYILKGVAGEIYPCKPDIWPLTFEEVSAELLEHVHPQEYLPGSHWAVTEAWTIVDSVKPGLLSEEVRCYLAGSIAGTLVRLRQELS